LQKKTPQKETVTNKGKIIKFQWQSWLIDLDHFNLRRGMDLVEERRESQAKTALSVKRA